MKKKPTALFRWLVLVVISLAMFGNYYLYDSVAPVASLLKSQLGFTQTDIGQLNMYYSIAAIAALVFGGAFIDKYGTRISILVFGSVCSLAGMVTMLSDNMMVMLTGRLILGLGAEPLIVGITVAVAKWFKGKEIAFAMGVNLMIARSGSLFANKAPAWFPELFDHWQSALRFAAVIGLFCGVAALVYFFQEGYGKRKYALGEGGDIDKLSFKGFFNYNGSYWLIVMLCLTFYSAIFPFYSTFSFLFFEEFKGLSTAAAGGLLAFLPISSMFATPLIGLLVDFKGRRASLMTLGSVLLMPVFLLIAYTSVNLIIPVAMLGVAFSLIPAIMWPSVAFVVEEKKLGKAYAFMTLLQQAGVAGMNWFLGWLNESNAASANNPLGYIPMVWALSALGILALVFSLWLRKVETGPRSHGLEKSTIK
jgi:MFS family permease